jgi:hypothetical protein
VQEDDVRTEAEVRRCALKTVEGTTSLEAGEAMRTILPQSLWKEPSATHCIYSENDFELLTSRTVRE